MIFGEHRNKRGGHGALRKELTEQIRDTIGDKKCIRSGSRTKESCDNHVSDKPKDAAGKRGDPDDAGRFDD